MINIYWTRSNLGHNDLKGMQLHPRSMISALRFAEPMPLLKHIDYQNLLGPMVSRCPAVIDDLKNIFVIKSPIDINIKIDHERSNIQVDNQTPDLVKAFLGASQGKWGIHQLGFGYLFFTEQSMMTYQLPAYLDDNDFTRNTMSISAGFDVGSWFRTMGKPAIIFKPSATKINIKEGDALAYVKFATKEKVTLIEFDDEELKRMQERSPELLCGTLKDQNAGNVLSLEKCYQYFNRYKMKRRVMKLIKRNII